MNRKERERRETALNGYIWYAPYKVEILKDRQSLRHTIAKVKKCQEYLDGAITTEMIGEERVMQKISIAKLQSYLVDRIESYLENGLPLLSTNIRYWTCYIKFCERNLRDDDSTTFTRCFKQHGPYYPELWMGALYWFERTERDEQTMEDVFHEAIKYHPGIDKIYKMYFGIVIRQYDRPEYERKRKMLAINELAKANLQPTSTILRNLQRSLNRPLINQR